MKQIEYDVIPRWNPPIFSWWNADTIEVGNGFDKVALIEHKDDAWTVKWTDRHISPPDDVCLHFPYASNESAKQAVKDFLKRFIPDTCAPLVALRTTQELIGGEENVTHLPLPGSLRIVVANAPLDMTDMSNPLFVTVRFLEGGHPVVERTPWREVTKWRNWVHISLYDTYMVEAGARILKLVDAAFPDGWEMYGGSLDDTSTVSI